MSNFLKLIKWPHPHCGWDCLAIKIDGVLQSGRSMVVLEYDDVIWENELLTKGVNRNTLQQLVDNPKATRLIQIV